VRWRLAPLKRFGANWRGATPARGRTCLTGSRELHAGRAVDHKRAEVAGLGPVEQTGLATVANDPWCVGLARQGRV